MLYRRLWHMFLKSLRLMATWNFQTTQTLPWFRRIHPRPSASCFSPSRSHLNITSLKGSPWPTYVQKCPLIHLLLCTPFFFFTALTKTCAPLIPAVRLRCGSSPWTLSSEQLAWRCLFVRHSTPWARMGQCLCAARAQSMFLRTTM